MIDFHSHIIPKIDDGSSSFEETLEMLKIAKNDGVDAIVATPHFVPGRFENEYKDILNHIKTLNEYIKNENINITIYPSQEVYITRSTLKYLNEGLIGTLNDTRYIQIELPFFELPDYTFDIIYELRIKNLIPILCHPERYAFIINSLENINKFIDEGCLFQINSGSILGHFGKEVQKTAKMLIENNIIDVLGSDAHNSKNRLPKIKDAFDKVKEIDENLSKKILENERKIIENLEITSSAQKINKKRGIFGFFKLGRG